MTADLRAHLGEHPQHVSYYLRLVVATFRTMLDLAMLVVGSALVGLGVAVLVDTLGVVDVGLGLGIAGGLGSALVLAVVGAFALGVASEGGYGAPAATAAFPSLEVAIGRILGGVVVSLLLVWGGGRLVPLVADLAQPLRAGVGVVESVGTAGLWTAVVGVPMVWGLGRGLDRLGWWMPLELPGMYVLWVIITLALLDPGMA